MKKAIYTLIFFLIVFNIYSSQNSTNSTRSSSSSSVIIKLPLKLKWGLKINQAAKILSIRRLPITQGKWAKIDKEGKRYWLYFTPSTKKLSKIIILFKHTSIFSSFMNTFTYKYWDLKIKTNLYRDTQTLVSILPTIRPEISFTRR